MSERDDMMAQSMSLTAENERLRAEAVQLRARLNVSETELAAERTLTQKLGQRCRDLFQEAHRACVAWETVPSRSVHDIRIAMRKLRELLNKPNTATLASAQPAAPYDPAFETCPCETVDEHISGACNILEGT